MSTVALIKLLHVSTALWMVSGLLGRWIVLAAASRAVDIGVTRSMLDVAGRFERGMVQPASIGVLLSGLWLAHVQNQPLLGMFQGSGANWLLVSLVLYLTSIPLVVGVFLPRARTFGRAMNDAVTRGSVTDELRAAFADRAVFAGHVTELVIVSLILFLMVTKAF